MAILLNLLNVVKSYSVPVCDVCGAARLFFAWLVSVPVSLQYVIAGCIQELYNYLFKHVPVLPLKMSLCMATGVHPAVILL